MVCRIACALLLTFAVGAAASDDSAKDDLVITLERTACFGTCPVYKLTIRGDGSITYEGHKFVRIEGTRQATTDPEEVIKLAQAFIDAGYFDLRDHYRSIRNPDGTETMVTDLPTTYTSITMKGRRKAVEDYVGAPKELEDLERKIDEATGSKRWVEIDVASVHDEVHHGLNVNGLEARRLFLKAAMRGDVDVVRAFIDEGVDVNARVGQLVPLQQASGAAVVKLLIAAGADVNATSREYFGPPLVFAAEEGDVDSIKALLDAGAKVNSRTPAGETPLMKAAGSGSPAAVLALLQAGADVRARTPDGEDAMKYARNALSDQEKEAKEPSLYPHPIPDFGTKYKEIEDLLRAAGATDSEPAHR